MKTRRLIAIVLAFLLVVLCGFPGLAEKDPKHWGSQRDHNRWTNAILFGNESYTSFTTADNRKAIELLDDALLLCIDQFKGEYKDKLQKLNAAGIPGIPRDLSEIDLKNVNSKTHRVYTHRGWNFDYTPSEYEKGHADKRRDLLYAVVNYVFDFQHSGLSEDVAKNKCEAMCCLLYITHIIGDRYHSAQYYGAAITQIFAEGEGTVIGDLIKILPTLLSESDCSVLIMKLKSLSAEIIRSERKLTGESLREVDSNYALELKVLLKYYLPDLLQKQSWFSNTFEEKWASY